MAKVAREMVEKSGVNVDELLELLIKNASAELTTFYYYTILRVNLIGLEGEGLKAIAETARIVGIADAFDAMTSDRPYREGIPGDTAVGIVRQESGSQFCPFCVALFLQWAEDELGYKGVVPEMENEG